MSKTQCAKCGREVLRQPFRWFQHDVVLDADTKAMVSIKVEVMRPRHGRLCLRCTGDVITSASSALHAKLVETAIGTEERMRMGKR